jgi:hypothetical protein
LLLTDFMRTAVLLFGAAASLLAALAVVGASGDADILVLYVGLAWWAVAAMAGGWLGRRTHPSPGISRMLSGARTSLAIPELEPARVIVYRLWALAVFALACGGLGVLLPQVPAIGAGYALLVALAWRRQEAAVKAIEGRDGARFYVERGSPFKPTRVVRTPGLRKVEPDFERVRQASGAT